MKFLLNDYLKSLTIAYKDSGKNIGEGWMGLQNCPLCGDKRFHFGVYKKTGSFNCWVCGERGNLIKLIELLEEVSYVEATNRIKEFSLSDEQQNTLLDTITNIFKKQEDIKVSVKKNFELPKTISLQEAMNRYVYVFNYLKGRGFNKEDIAKWDKDIGYCAAGEYAMRLVFPLKIDGKVVSFTSRAVLPTEKKSKNCPKAKALISSKDCLFNYDKIKENQEIAIVEGVFDVLTVEKHTGWNVIGLLGKQMSSGQKVLLMKKKPSGINLILDRDAWGDAISLKVELESLLLCGVKVTLIQAKDPADFYSKQNA